MTRPATSSPQPTRPNDGSPPRRPSDGSPPPRPAAGRVRPLLLACTALLAAGAVARVFGAVAVTSWAALRGPSPDSAADLIVLAVAAAGVLLTTWLGLSFAVAGLAALPGTVGAAFELAADRMAPTAVRRAVAVVLGTALTASLLPGAAGAAAMDSGGRQSTTSRAASAAHSAFGPAGAALPGSALPGSTLPGSALPGFALPESVLSGAAHPRSAPPGAPDPAFRATSGPLSAAASDTTPPPAPDPSFRPTAPMGTGAGHPAYTPAAPLHPTTPRVLGPLDNTPRAGTSVEENVVVRRGDTLWDIAARHLGGGATTAEIAYEWPRWHAANRAVIGEDPDRIRPGQRLTPPTAAR